MKLIILDRDGVINEDSDHYVRSAAEWIPIPGSIDAISRLHRAGYSVVVATNQSGLGRGFFGLEDLEAMHAKLASLLQAAGGAIAGIFYCPHAPEDNCACRKPAPGLLDAIAAEFSCDLAGTPIVGDSLRDLQAGIKRGCVPLLVRTGKGAGTELKLKQAKEPQLQNVRVFDNLSAVCDYLLDARGEPVT